MTLTNGTLTVNPYAFSYTIGNDSQTYGTPADLAADLRPRSTRGSTARTWRSATAARATRPRPTWALRHHRRGVRRQGLASDYTVTLTNGTLTVNQYAFSYTIGNDSQTYGTPPTWRPTCRPPSHRGQRPDLAISYSQHRRHGHGPRRHYAITGVVSNGRVWPATTPSP